MTESRVNCEPGSMVSVLDRGLQYGDGLFETIAFIDGKPRYWERHMARLADGCARLAIPAPEASMLRTEADRACGGEQRAIVKVMLTRGSGVAAPWPTTIIVTSRAWPADLDTWLRDGLVARLSDRRIARNPRLAGIKHLNRLEYVMAENDGQPDGRGETILRDTHGYVIETCRANIFIVRDRRLYTPDLRYAGVRGVMRNEVMAIAQQAGIAVVQASLTPRELFAADEIFVTNAVMGVCPVRQVEDQPFLVGPLTRMLQAALA